MKSQRIKSQEEARNETEADGNVRGGNGQGNKGEQWGKVEPRGED